MATLANYENAAGYFRGGGEQDQSLALAEAVSSGQYHGNPEVISGLLNALKNRNGDVYDQGEPDDDGYQTFIFEEMRCELYAAGWRLSEYAMTEGLSAVYFLDRSARPAYVAMKGFWRARYPNEPMPHIGFLNPKGFVSQEDVLDGTVDLSKATPKDRRDQDKVEPASYIRPRQEIVAEIKESINTDDRRRPIALFDVCIHDGSAIRPTIGKLAEAGLEDVRLGVMSPIYNRSDIEPDFCVMDKETTGLCYSFGRDGLTSKTYRSIYPEPNTSVVDRARGMLLREEIRLSVQEFTNIHNSLAALTSAQGS